MENIPLWGAWGRKSLDLSLDFGLRNPPAQAWQVDMQPRNLLTGMTAHRNPTHAACPQHGSEHWAKITLLPTASGAICVFCVLVRFACFNLLTLQPFGGPDFFSVGYHSSHHPICSVHPEQPLGCLAERHQEEMQTGKWEWTRVIRACNEIKNCSKCRPSYATCLQKYIYIYIYTYTHTKT